MRGFGLEAVIFGSALGIEPQPNGNRLNKRGFANTVFAHEKGNRLVKGQLAHAAQIINYG